MLISPLLAQQDLIRPFVSLDIDDIISLLGVAAVIVGYFVVKKTATRSDEKIKAHEVTEVVDGSVLGRFAELMERITALEKDLAETRVDLRLALDQIGELRKLEEYLQAKLHEKDAEIRALHSERTEMLAEHDKLRAMLDEANERICHLEDVCRSAGLNDFG